MRRVINKLWCSAVALLLSASPQLQAQVFDSEHYRISVVTVAERLDQPWGLAFLPDGDFLVTELSGGLKRVTPDGQHVSITGLPPIQKHGQGGLLDVVLDPDFANNRRIYLTYSGFGGNGIGTDALRGELVDDRLTNASIIFRMRPKSGGGRHFGSRMAWLEDGSLLISLGDRGKRARAQRLDDHIGTIVRINPDGEVPRDNPFVGRADALPEIYSYGHRNVQGMVRDPVTGDVWSMEHGPQGGDEINLVRPGVNYGWPTITYGVNYFVGTSIGEGTEREGMAQPNHQWTPSIAPSGLAIYRGDKFPKWEGDLLAGALKFQLLSRLTVRGDNVVEAERLLADEFGRIRDVRVGPDGYIYLLTDSSNGKLLRLEPAS